MLDNANLLKFLVMQVQKILNDQNLYDFLQMLSRTLAKRNGATQMATHRTWYTR